jgi:hypothetical protein
VARQRKHLTGGLLWGSGPAAWRPLNRPGAARLCVPKVPRERERAHGRVHVHAHAGGSLNPSRGKNYTWWSWWAPHGACGVQAVPWAGDKFLG